jgi:hypothetical protein
MPGECPENARKRSGASPRPVRSRSQKPALRQYRTGQDRSGWSGSGPVLRPPECSLSASRIPPRPHPQPSQDPPRDPSSPHCRRSGAAAVFEYLPLTTRSPQIWGVFPLHSLGIRKLSILLPQGRLPILHQARSRGWGFVVNGHPQPVDKIFVHRAWMKLSTGGPQAELSCPQLPAASPHLCPLFGNAAPPFTAPSERRHTKRVGWAVGNLGKAGDSPGEKPPCPVHRMCRTFLCPQKRRVVHRCRPQGQWIKNRT